jgi:hypothetical protein
MKAKLEFDSTQDKINHMVLEALNSLREQVDSLNSLIKLTDTIVSANSIALNNSEKESQQDVDVTFSYQASSGIFDYSVCLTEVDDNKRLEIYTGTESISAYRNGRDEEPEYWDNAEFFRDVRDGIYNKYGNDLSPAEVSELQDLLIAVSEKGWL